jgi:hypothetical protein
MRFRGHSVSMAQWRAAYNSRNGEAYPPNRGRALARKGVMSCPKCGELQDNLLRETRVASQLLEACRSARAVLHATSGPGALHMPSSHVEIVLNQLDVAIQEAAEDGDAH